MNLKSLKEFRKVINPTWGFIFERRVCMTVAFYTLGCKVNLYESEYLINEFRKRNYKIVDFNDKADIYIINTCTVTNTSDVKSKKMIRKAIRQNKDAIIVVMGCLAQIKHKELSNIKEIDSLIVIKIK